MSTIKYLAIHLFGRLPLYIIPNLCNSPTIYTYFLSLHASSSTLHFYGSDLLWSQVSSPFLLNTFFCVLSFFLLIVGYGWLVFAHWSPSFHTASCLLWRNHFIKSDWLPYIQSRLIFPLRPSICLASLASFIPIQISLFYWLTYRPLSLQCTHLICRIAFHLPLFT